MRYFDHDTTAGSDSKILALRLEHGSVAIDLYWTLLELMYANESPLNLVGSKLETKSVLHLVSINQKELETYVNTMLELGLLEGSVENLFSQRAMDNIAAYQQRAETARQNGKKGGRKPTAETEKKPSRLKGGNQSAKLRKEKKGIGLDKLNQIPTADVSGGKNPATTADGYAVFDEVDEQYPDPTGYEPKDMQAYAEEFGAAVEQDHPEAISCPPELLTAVVGNA